MSRHLSQRETLSVALDPKGTVPGVSEISLRRALHLIDARPCDCADTAAQIADHFLDLHSQRLAEIRAVVLAQHPEWRPLCGMHEYDEPLIKATVLARIHPELAGFYADTIAWADAQFPNLRRPIPIWHRIGGGVVAGLLAWCTWNKLHSKRKKVIP